MKKTISLIVAMLALLLTSCNEATPLVSENPTLIPPQTVLTESNNATTSPEKTNPINSMEKLVDVGGVVSVTKQSFSNQIKGVVAYKVLLETDSGKLASDVVLPDDYAQENKSYPVLIYFPQVGTNIDALASNYALNDIIVIRPYSRGYDESEGVRDLGGQKDLADAQKLLELFDSANFIENSKIFVAGSSEGSINALRLFAEDTEHRISGCAVVDAITDLYSLGVARGEGVQNLFKTLIGKTYEESPSEYEIRSAVKFSEKLDRPVLILHYLQSPLLPIEQADSLYELLKDNKDCSYYKIDDLSADFYGEGLQRLLSWINKYD